MEKEHQIDAVIRALNIMRECGGYTRKNGYEEDAEYMAIYRAMLKYAKCNCTHEWTRDVFEISDELSHTVFYCKKCGVSS